MTFEVIDMTTPSCACMAKKVKPTPAIYCQSVYSKGKPGKFIATTHPTPAKTNNTCRRALCTRRLLKARGGGGGGRGLRDLGGVETRNASERMETKKAVFFISFAFHTYDKKSLSRIYQVPVLLHFFMTA